MIALTGLLDNPESQVCDGRRLNRSRAFQLGMGAAQVVEEPDPFTQQDWHQVNLYFVEQSRLNALISKRGTTQDIDVSFTCGCLEVLHCHHGLSKV